MRESNGNEWNRKKGEREDIHKEIKNSIFHK